MDFNKIIDSWQKEYYTELVLLIFELIALITCIFHARKSFIGKLFIFYIATDLTLYLAHYYLYLQDNINYNKQLFYSTSNVYISLVELLVYYFFFYKVLNIRKYRPVFLILASIYTILAITYIFTKFNFISNRSTYYSFLLTAIEFCLLIPPCILYYRQLFNFIKSDPLTKRPSFWIVTGIFFYSLISIPYFLLTVYFSESKFQYQGILNSLLFNIPFSINFIFITKAVLCKKPLTI